ncbi:sigma-70 family RNA polymerase sigma factor [Kibdelosporangium philippinense]|uniref:Sigma-70 family RNA polymerase sigma factor n=2 Tax=Kibdelosporangium philippinense TaxID=211113 RepID=A0ABS8ZHI4_9PSEU|nr:sigma-70 family RNA polymerase sigma factor [Kibdelosporangium philippinense]MCE7007235.1 sigma-70 family RNA polymerase sigma factor [Kibdelosporangium philippinense]
MADLLEAARRGDQASLADLVDELTPLLWQVARAQGFDRDASSDIVQTAWLKLLGAVAEIRSPMALTSWLVTVTRREAWRVRNATRMEVPAKDVMFAELPDLGPTPEERRVEIEHTRQLWLAVGTLSDRCQQLLRIIAFTRRPDYDTVSAALGMPRGSIGPTRGRCLAKLRDALSADFAEES